MLYVSEAWSCTLGVPANYILRRLSMIRIWYESWLYTGYREGRGGACKPYSSYFRPVPLLRGLEGLRLDKLALNAQMALSNLGLLMSRIGLWKVTPFSFTWNRNVWLWASALLFHFTRSFILNYFCLRMVLVCSYWRACSRLTFWWICPFRFPSFSASRSRDNGRRRDFGLSGGLCRVWNIRLRRAIRRVRANSNCRFLFRTTRVDSSHRKICKLLDCWRIAFYRLENFFI